VRKINVNIIVMENNIHNELEYLMSADMYQKYMATQEKEIKVNFTNDKKFYRRRIIQLTKDLFKENEMPQGVKNNFNNYIKHCIMYLKIVDKTDILQKQYGSIEGRDLSKREDISMCELDSEFLKSGLNPPVATLDNYVIKTNTDAPHPPPQKKIVNLKTPELKNKGIKGKGGKNRKKKKKDINK
jgi:hypothetical protein